MNEEPREYEIEPEPPRAVMRNPPPPPPPEDPDDDGAEDSFDQEPNDTPEVVDAQTHRAPAMLAYVLFFIPLVSAPKSKFAMFHANQGFIVFLFGLAWFIFVSVNSILWKLAPTNDLISFPLMILNCFTWLFAGAWFCSIAFFIIKGLLNAADGNVEPLPILGHIKVIQPPTDEDKP